MTIDTQNLVICFPSGAGGHLIGTVCKVLLGYPESFPDQNGAMHSAKSLSGFIHVNASLSQDTIIRQKLPKRDVIIGHFTNVELLVEVGRKVIYITFTQDDLDEIVYRSNKKTQVNLKDRNTYTLLAGESWPPYEEFLAGALIPETQQQWVVTRQHYDHWEYNLPQDKINTLEVKFSSIISGYELIDDIANFMNIENYTKEKLVNLLDRYRQANIQLGQL